MTDVEPVWEVRTYPSGFLIHTAPDYFSADNWRVVNHLNSVIVPHWRHSVPSPTH